MSSAVGRMDECVNADSSDVSDQTWNWVIGSPGQWVIWVIQYNTKFVQRHVAVASEALANRSVKKQRRRRTNVL